jgi:hypothetical protein
MCKQETEIAELSFDDLRTLISETVEKMLNEQNTFELDRALGRCPYCHGKEVLIDPVLNDRVPCICTGIDPRIVLGVA